MTAQEIYNLVTKIKRSQEEETHWFRPELAKRAVDENFDLLARQSLLPPPPRLAGLQVGS